MTDNSENLVLAQKLFEWFKKGEMDRFVSVLHADVEARPSINGGAVLKGRDEVARWYGGLVDADGDVEARPLDYELTGNCVIVRGYLFQREGSALAERLAFWLYEIGDGQVIRMESHPTRAAALNSAGAA